MNGVWHVHSPREMPRRRGILVTTALTSSECNALQLCGYGGLRQRTAQGGVACVSATGNVRGSESVQTFQRLPLNEPVTRGCVRVVLRNMDELRTGVMRRKSIAL